MDITKQEQSQRANDRLFDTRLIAILQTNKKKQSKLN